MDKQDRQGARTVPQLEQKYSFGKSFAEVYGIATGARTTAEEAKETAEEAKTKAENPDHKAIFNALTADGTLEGLYRKDGSLYINASYIQSGVYAGETELFLEPGQPEVDKCWQYALWILEQTPEAIALFDFNGDGEIGQDDAQAAEDAMNGNGSLAGSPIAKLSKVKIQIDVRNPNKTISFSATNMWGRVLDYSIGINNPVFTDDGRGNLYRIVDGEKEWLNPPIGAGGADGAPIGTELDGTPYRTVERDGGIPIYKRVNTDMESGLYGVAEYGYSNGYGAKWYPLYPQDAVIERGTDGIWTYEKWHSGKAVCYGSRTDTISWGGSSICYYSNETVTQALPLIFLDSSTIYPQCTATCGGAYVTPMCHNAPSGFVATVYGRFYGGTDSLSVTTNYYIVGRWK